ncbi:sterile alpha motif domain-containing protein 9-like isoform X3 [Petromyzon marinus]|nr:sterile alpha motif domain-containing protein 9-like isoform X2 [Petromyzon marinus]XP_032811150.1 sterile alpha motif domain-containing protein 9-like isoform X2 [Petromyzon marinus]
MCSCTERVWQPIHNRQKEVAAQLRKVQQSTVWELQDTTQWLAEYSIYVRDVDLLLWEITVNPASTLEDVVESLGEKGVKIPTIASFFCGCRKILQGSPLQNFGVGNGTNIEVCLGLLGGGRKKKNNKQQMDNVSAPTNVQDGQASVSQDEQQSDQHALYNLSLQGASGGAEETTFVEDKGPHVSPMGGGDTCKQSKVKNKKKAQDPAVGLHSGSTSPSELPATAKTEPSSGQLCDAVDSEGQISQETSGGEEMSFSEGDGLDRKGHVPQLKIQSNKIVLEIEGGDTLKKLKKKKKSKDPAVSSQSGSSSPSQQPATAKTKPSPEQLCDTEDLISQGASRDAVTFPSEGDCKANKPVSEIEGGDVMKKSKAKKKSKCPAVSSQPCSTSQKPASVKTKPSSWQLSDTVDSEDRLMQGPSGGTDSFPSEGGDGSNCKGQVLLQNIQANKAIEETEGGATWKKSKVKKKKKNPVVSSHSGSTSPRQQPATAKTKPSSGQLSNKVDSQGASGGAETPPFEGGDGLDSKGRVLNRNIQVNKTVSETEERRPENMKDWKDNHVQNWLREIQFNESSCDKLKQEEVTGAVLVVLSKEDCDSFKIPRGQMILLIKKRDEYLSKSVQDTVPVSTIKLATDLAESESEKKKELPQSKRDSKGFTETPAMVDPNCTLTIGNEGREIIFIDPCPFESDSSKYSYGKGKCLPPESGKGNLITPCHEYKAFQPGTCTSEEKKRKSFINETFRFASACINSRTNGTIHFGVGDKENGCLHAEVLGVDVSDVRNYQQWLLDGLATCLCTDDERTIVSSCMRPPRFVKVSSSGTHLANNLFVIEVDIVPAHKTCGNKIVRVKLIPDVGKGAKEIAFKRDRDLSEKIGNIEQYLENNLPVLINRRLKCEKVHTSKTERKAMHTDLDLKLTKLITGGEKTLDESTYDHYLLVTNSPETDSILKDVTFIKEIPWLAVLDFNSKSYYNGLHKMFRVNKLAVQLNSPQAYDGWYKGLDKFCDDMKIGKICQWIYCNGWSPLNDSKEAWMDVDMWHRDRSSAVANVINFLCTRVLQTGTHLVVFLLLSTVDSEKDPMLEVLKCFYKEMHGHQHMLCLADNENTYDKWISLQSILKPEELEDRCMKGMKMREVNDTVLSIKKETRMDKKFIPEFNGALCIVDDETEKDMSTLNVLYLNQCEDCAIEEDENKFRKFKLEEETNYYKGGKITWWLFYFTDRGYSKCWFKRDNYDTLKRAITRQEQNTYQSVKIVNLFHHPGCGGTTMGMNVLWDLRKDFRCAVVNDNVHNTLEIARNVVHLLTYNKEDDTNVRQEDGFISVLLLVDNAAFDVGQLRKNISKQIDGKGCRVTRPTVFILSCCRATNPETLCQENPNTSIPLTHTLTKTETTAIVEKHHELEKEHLEKTKSFISFMVMKNNFSRDYVTKLVEDSLQSVPNSQRELDFLAYVALLSVYVEDFSLPVSHCQQFFGIHGYLSNFRTFLHKAISFLLIDLQREQYNLYRAIRIVHPMVAEEILKHLYSKMSTDLTKIALNFFQEEAMFHHRFAQDDFLKSVNEMLIKRQYKEHRHPLDSLRHVATEQIDAEELELDKALFSNLVIAICEESKGQAAAIEVLEKAFKMLSEEPFSAFIAQAIARLLIKSEKYDDAKIWAKKACDIRQNNPFIFNTLGQTYRAEMKHTFRRKLIKKERIQERDLCKALELARDASHWFKESQEAQSQESTTINVSGFLDELDVALYIIKLLSLTGMFHCDSPLGKLSLQNYLMKDTETLPSSISSLWAPYHDYLKNLVANIERCLDWVIREVLYHKASDFMTKKYHQLCETYAEVSQLIYSPHQLSKKKEIIANAVGDDIKLKMAGGSNFEFLLKKLFDPQMEKRLCDIFTLLKNLMNTEDMKYFPHYFIVNCAICYYGPSGTKATHFQEMYNKGLEIAGKICRGIYESTPYPYFVIALLLLPNLEHLTEEQTRYLINSLEQMYTLYKRHAAKKAFTFSTKNNILYLGQGEGYTSIVHRTQLHQFCELKQWHEQRKWWFQEVWTNSEVCEKLKRVRGFVRSEDKIFISTAYEDLNIPVTPSNLSYTRCRSYIEEVEFFVAYSLCGLFAYDIKPVRVSNKK